MKSKYLDNIFPYPTQEEMLEGMHIRREFLKRNTPANILKRQSEIDESRLYSPEMHNEYLSKLAEHQVEN